MRRFNRLLRLIANRDWLAEASRIVLASSGAGTPGIDGIDKQTLQRELGNHLVQLRRDLLQGTYGPQPVKRVYIRKANGKLRPLGIPTLTDRIVQRAMLMVMEPIWESDFHGCSYGFRPERSVHHAVRTVKLQLQDGTRHERPLGHRRRPGELFRHGSPQAASEMCPATYYGQTLDRSALAVSQSRPR